MGEGWRDLSDHVIWSFLASGNGRPPPAEVCQIQGSGARLAWQSGSAQLGDKFTPPPGEQQPLQTFPSWTLLVVQDPLRKHVKTSRQLNRICIEFLFTLRARPKVNVVRNGSN